MHLYDELSFYRLYLVGLRNKVGAAGFVRYEIQVPYFKSGTCEQFLEFMDKVQALIVGQNLTTGPQWVALMQTVLKGDTYTYFIQYFMTVGNEDDVTFILGVHALTPHIFPQRAFCMQKRYMRCYMCKPRDMKMRVYRN